MALQDNPVVEIHQVGGIVIFFLFSSYFHSAIYQVKVIEDRSGKFIFMKLDII